MKPTPSQIEEVSNTYYFGVLVLLLASVAKFFGYAELGSALIVIGSTITIPALIAYWIFVHRTNKPGS
jgi:hypothetical protein